MSIFRVIVPPTSIGRERVTDREPAIQTASRVLTRPLKIAMIGQKGLPATYGGIEHHVENLSLGMIKRGHSVTVFCRPHYSLELDSYPEINRLDANTYNYRDIHLHLLKSIKTKHLDAISHTINSTIAALKDDYDIIHYHGIGPSFVSFLPALLNRKVISTVHAFDFRQKKWGQFARLCLKAGLKNALSFPTKTICVSRTIKGQLGDPAKSIYIPNGVRDPYFWSHDELDWMKLHGLEPGRYILFVGRLIEDKGCHLLAQAMRGLPAGLKLAIAGDSSFTDDYVARLKQIAGPESVFLGSVYNEKLSALYANCALFVLPSAVEGLPLVIIEAMKHRAPVLVSDIPENMEIIDNEPDGRPVSLSFKTGSIDSLKRSIEFALSHPERLKMLATNAFSYINDSYNWREIVRQTEAVYYEAAGL